MLAATLLQVLEAKFRRLGLVLNGDADEPLRVMRQPAQLTEGRCEVDAGCRETRTAYCCAMSARWRVTLSRLFLSSVRSLSADFSFRS